VLERWVLAFAVAVVVALALTPMLARGPDARWNRGRVPLATSAAPVLGTVAGSLCVVSDMSTTLVVGLLAAAWLWSAGQLAELGHLPIVIERITILTVAGVLTANGLRLEVTGVQWADVVATVAVVSLALTAWRSAATRDGMLLWLAAATAAAAGLIGGLAGQIAVAGVAAATVGACAGVAPYLLPPLAVRLRAGGARFLGCVVIVLAFEARPDVRAPGSAVVPLLLVALSLVDAALVTAAKLRSRRAASIEVGLAGRWRALGASRGVVSVGLPLVQVALGCLAVLVARTLVSPGGGAVAGSAIVLAITVPTLFARAGSGKRSPRLALALAGLLVAGVLVLTLPAAYALWRARDTAGGAADAIRAGLAAARAGDTQLASANFETAATRFSEARTRLADPLATLGLHMPVIGPNLDAARQLTEIGAALSRTGSQLTTSANPQSLRIVNATVDVNEMRRLAPELEATIHELEAALARVNSLDRDFLITPIDNAISKLRHALHRSIRDGRMAALATKVVPGIVGADGDRRYVLALQNPAEARATGGIFGSWAEITAVDGKLDLVAHGNSSSINPVAGERRVLHAGKDYTTRYARFGPERFWQNVNLSPDLPTVGPVAIDAWKQAGRAPVDGVIALDPLGLAAVLRLTGPVTVTDWPGPITADNVVDVTTRQAYTLFADNDDARDNFLGDVTDATWHALEQRDLGTPATLFRTIGRAAHGKHLMMWFARPAEERLARRAHADGSAHRGTAGAFTVTAQNAAANKLDAYLQRRVRYEATLTPTAGNQVQVDASAIVKLRNDAPASGLSTYVAGPNTPGLVEGENRTFVSVYTPLLVHAARINGAPTATESGRELGNWVYSTYIDLLPGKQARLAIELQGTERLGAGRRFTLRMPHQAALEPTPTHVTLSVPSGWRFARVKGATVVNGGRRVMLDRPAGRDLSVRMRIVRDFGSGLWGRLQTGGDLRATS
jgi:hypothetical protein